MHIEIKNGATIIHTGKAQSTLQNKLGCTGVYYIEKLGVYKADITHKKRKYCVYVGKSLDKAIKARKEADLHVTEGDFAEWIAERKKRA